VPHLLGFLSRERVAYGAVGLRIFPEAPAGSFARVRDGRFLLVTRPTPGRRGGTERRSRELVAARARDLTLADVDPVAWGFPRSLVLDGNIDAASWRASGFSRGLSRAARRENRRDQRAQEVERRKRARRRQRPPIIHTDGAASILREPTSAGARFSPGAALSVSLSWPLTCFHMAPGAPIAFHPRIQCPCLSS